MPLVLPFLGLWVTGSQVLDPRVPVLRFLDPWVPCSLGPRFVFNPPKWGGSTTTSNKSYNTQQEYNLHHFVLMWTLVMLGWDYLCNKNIRFKSTVTVPGFKVRKEGSFPPKTLTVSLRHRLDTACKLQANFNPTPLEVWCSLISKDK